MKSKERMNMKATLKVALAITIGWMCWSAGTKCSGQTLASNPSGLSPDLQEVVKLSQQHMSEDVITSYIKNAGKSYKLGAEDIIYLNSQGVSQGVIRALLQTAGSGGNPAEPPAPQVLPATSSSPTPGVASPSPEPPPLDGNLPAPGPGTPPPSSPPAQTGLQDNFFSDTGLNPSLWETQSGVLTALASMRRGSQVLPVFAFSPSGMQMSGVRGPAQFMGIQSRASFMPPFRFSATVTGLEQNVIPFEVYLVSGDLRQWVSIAGHLGGRGGPRGDIRVGGFGRFFRGDARIPLGGSAPEYGVWINYTGSGLPVSALGHKLFNDPFADVPYTIQVAADAGGAASVSLLNSAGGVLAARDVPVGTGPFHIVLAGRDGPTSASWQSVQLAPATPVVAEAPAVPNLDYFQAQLTPYGSWVNVPGYGLCWQPSVAPGWRPYYDGGYWVYSDAGWYWQSGYPWGDIAFHYGRWAYTATGWVWAPGYDYAPAWVVWRHADADGYLGWAPLPPGAIFVEGGWVFNGARVGVSFDFGLGVGLFTFVAYDHFWEHDFRHFIVPHDRLARIYGRSLIESHYRLDHGRFINEGLSRDRMAALTHRDIKPMAVHDLKRQEEQRNIAARRDDIRDFKPGKKPDATRMADRKPEATPRADLQGHPGQSGPNNNRPDVGQGARTAPGNFSGNSKGQPSSESRSQAGAKGGNPDSAAERKDNGR